MTDAAVVVAAFRPGPSLLRLIEEVVAEFRTIVVDDGSGSPFDKVFEEAAAAGALILRSEDNRGIGNALNRGLRAAFAEGRSAAITFDQDSLPEPGALSRLVRAHDDSSSSRRPVGVIVPGRFADVRQARGDLELADARRVIQSGMLIPQRTVSAIGYLDETLFIDLVDTEYELRCLTAGLRVVAVRRAAIAHELGSPVRLLPLGPRLRMLAVETMVSSPFRYYYRARNRVILWRRYGRRMAGRLAVDTAIDLAYGAVVGLSARPRRTFWLLVRAGIRAGRHSVRGRMPDELNAAARTITWSVSDSVRA